MKTAVIAARGLGDGLLSMIIAYNLSCMGEEVVLFSSPLCQLSQWFPSVPIHPFPLPESYHRVFTPFDRLIIADHACLNESHQLGNQKIVIKEQSLDHRKTMVENLVGFCQKTLKLKDVQSTNGITPPSHLSYQKQTKRVIIHPESTSEKKNWGSHKYLQLCQELQQRGFDPALCMSPKERTLWQQKISQTSLLLPYFNTIDLLAAFIYESGGMIGNDSGLGHLASCLGIPSFSLFARRSYARLWRPGWGKNHVITPMPILLGARMKQKYWKNCISPSRVLKNYICTHKTYYS